MEPTYTPMINKKIDSILDAVNGEVEVLIGHSVEECASYVKEYSKTTGYMPGIIGCNVDLTTRHIKEIIYEYEIQLKCKMVPKNVHSHYYGTDDGLNYEIQNRHLIFHECILSKEYIGKSLIPTPDSLKLAKEKLIRSISTSNLQPFIKQEAIQKINQYTTYTTEISSMSEIFPSSPVYTPNIEDDNWGIIVPCG